MRYWGELRVNLRPLSAATLGMAAGYTLNNYLANLFLPVMMKSFGWTGPQVALLGTTALLSLVMQPLAGRLTDRFGVRPVALVGVVAGPLVYVAIAAMRGSFAVFVMLNLLQLAVVAPATGAVVYSRLIAQRFDHARGIALAIVACAPSLAGAAIMPALSAYSDRLGWRAAYLLVALVLAGAGALALALVPPERQPAKADRPKAADRVPMRQLLANPALAPVAIGMALCSLSVTAQTSQLKVLLLTKGVAPTATAGLISAYAIGVIVGRLGCGLALDRFAPHRVACVCLGLPSLGLGWLALGGGETWGVAAAVAMLGLSLGTELDVAGVLIMRFFPREVYSSALGLVIAGIALSGALGSFGLSMVLRAGGGFAPWLLICAACALVGSATLLRLGYLVPPDHGRQTQ